MVEKFGRLSETAGRVKIDAKDSKILVLLAENSRMPASEIAKKLLISRDAVAYRINRLQREGVILSFFPIVDLKRFGYFTFQFFMLLEEKAKQQHEALLSYIVQHPNTKSLMRYTDTWDVEWTIVAKTFKEFDSIITEALTKFPDVILEKEKIAVVKGYTSVHLPYCYFNTAKIKPDLGWVRRQKKDIKLDASDSKLLKLLCKNSRQSSYELGKALGLSPDAVVYRIKRLVDASVIRTFTILPNLSKLGHSWYTAVLNFKKFDTKDEAKFAYFVQNHPHIIRAVKAFGPWDVLLYIVADSPQNYHNAVKEIKNTFSDIIRNYQMWLAYEEYFFTPLPSCVAINK